MKSGRQRESIFPHAKSPVQGSLPHGQPTQLGAPGSSLGHSGLSFPAHLGANKAVGQCAFPSRPPESHLPPTVTSEAERTKDSSPHHFSWASGWLQSAQPFHPSESHSRNNAPAETTADRLRQPPSGCLVGNFLTRGFLFLLFPLLVPVLKAFWKRGVLVQAASAFHKFFIGRFFRKWSGAQKFNHIILI